jgi:hypothetical protein
MRMYIINEIRSLVVALSIWATFASIFLVVVL